MSSPSDPRRPRTRGLVTAIVAVIVIGAVAAIRRRAMQHNRAVFQATYGGGTDR